METRAFTKMHGIGNDFVIIDPRKRRLELSREQARAKTIELLRPEFDNRGQAIKLKFAKALPLAVFDAAQIKQSLINLMKNSMHAMSTGGELTIKTGEAELVIAAGRRTAPVARAIRRAGGAFIAQIMFPGVAGSDDFALIAVPRHDRIRERANVIRMTGAPHELTRAGIEEAAQRWRARLEHLSRPRIALMRTRGSTSSRDWMSGSIPP